MVIMHRVMAIAGVAADEGVADGDLARFRDCHLVSGWAKSAAAAVVQAGIFNGSADGLKPQAAMTRAEAAVLLYRLLTAAELINPVQ